MKKTLMIAVISSLTLVACKKEKAPEPAFEFECNETISYSSFITQEIFNTSCNASGCHADGAGGFFWANHEEISTNADLIYDVISHAPGAKQMPFGGPKLSDSLIAQFKCWIDQGKLDN